MRKAILPVAIVVGVGVGFAVMNATARRNPISGERMMNSSSIPHPFPTMMTLNPFFAIAEPASPLIRACDELVGSANSHVVMFRMGLAFRF